MCIISNKTKCMPLPHSRSLLSSGLVLGLVTVLLLSNLQLSNGQVKDMPLAAGVERTASQPPALKIDVNDSDFEKLVEAKLNESEKASAGRAHSHTQELLSRKRRYLVFPEGSSFQVVYDEYVCVVDYTNYLVLGITVALAWELPSKPPSEILEDLRTKLDEGTLDVSRNDTATNITYVDDATKPDMPSISDAYKPNYINLYPSGNKNLYYSSSPAFHAPMHPVYQHSDSYYRRPAAPPGWRRKDSHYYSYYKPTSSSRNPFERWTKPFNYEMPEKSLYPYWSLANRLRDTLRKHVPYGLRTQPFAQHPQGYVPETTTGAPVAQPPPRKHRIYPVFGKRSLPDVANPHHRQRRSGVAAVNESELSKLERIQIKHHRSSRQLLYERIEKYLNKRGLHGQHCVLRSLCETGQRSHEQEPGSFVGEIMRAVFTIPEALQNEPVAYQDARYDKAHATSKDDDCAQLYPECKQSMWKADFIQ